MTKIPTSKADRLRNFWSEFRGICGTFEILVSEAEKEAEAGISDGKMTKTLRAIQKILDKA